MGKSLQRRGGGKKRKEVVGETDGTELHSHILPSSPPQPQDIATLPANHRYPTRHSHAVANQCTSSTTPIKYSLRKQIGSCKHSYIKARRVLLEANGKLCPESKGIPGLKKCTSKFPHKNQVSTAPAMSSSYSSPRANIDKRVKSVGNSISIESQDWSAPISKDRLGIEKLTSRLVSQTEEPGDFHPVVAPPPTELRENLTETNLPNVGFNVIRDTPEMIATGHTEQKSRLSRCASLNLTEMVHMCNDIDDEEEVQSAIDPALVTVNGYRVKEEVASTLRAIFAKHGDISGQCTFGNPKARAPFLEIICGIYQKLDKTTFGDITNVELNEMLDLIGDLERNKLNVGWLHQKLLAISQAKCQLRDYCGLKEEKTRNLKLIERQEKELEKAKDNLEATKAKVKEIDEKILDTKERVSRFKTEKSLVNLALVNLASLLAFLSYC